MDVSLMNNISNICKNDYFYLMSLQNVNGVGLGYKYINSINTGELSIHVLVEKKMQESVVAPNNIVPKKYKGIKTDVIEIGFQTNKSTREKIRPLMAGYSISPQGLTEAGTIGCIVTRNNPYGGKYYYILTNNHVIADLTRGEIGMPLIQPGGIDGGSGPKDVVARLSEFIPLKIRGTGPKLENFIDAAIGKIIKPSLVKSNEIALVGKINGVSTAKLGDAVKKVGRTTGLTTGKVTTINATLDIKYSGRITSPFLFKNVIIADFKMDVGDSGSLVLNDENKAVALFFAGSGVNKSFCCDINTVLKELNVELYM